MSDSMIDKKTVIFFVTLPRKSKGLTGAVVGTQTVINALDGFCDVRVVEMKHTAINQNRGLFRRLSAIWDYLFSLKNLVREIRPAGRDPKFLYLNTASSMGGVLRDILTIKIARLITPSIMVVGHCRNGDFFFPKGKWSFYIRRHLLNIVDKLLILSERLLPDDETSDGWVDSGSIMNLVRIVPNTIDADFEKHAKENAGQIVKTNAKVSVLYLSNFIPSKGYEVLRDVVNIICEDGRISEFEFVFNGAWRNEADKHAFIQSFAPIAIEQKSVHVGDAIWDRREVSKLHAYADVFCLPTIYHAEAQPRSILEAMAHSSAIISTPVAAIPDMVDHGLNGFLTRAREPRSIVSFLYNFKDGRGVDMGCRSYEKYMETFSVEVHDERIREVFV